LRIWNLSALEFVFWNLEFEKKMAKKKKYYVVWDGNETGVFDSWTDCQLQIKGYPGARYKSFKTKEAAEEAYLNETGYVEKKAATAKPTLASLDEKIRAQIIMESISVDAACSGNPGVMEYRGVHTADASEIFRLGPFQYGTNNLGEFLALVHGLALLKQQGSDVPIYSDSRTAMAWVRNKRVKTTIKRTPTNKKMFTLVDRAILWLNNNTYTTKIIKWDTDNWGEIPADFGRK